MKSPEDPLAALLTAARGDDAAEDVKARVRAGVAAQILAAAGALESGSPGTGTGRDPSGDATSGGSGAGAGGAPAPGATGAADAGGAPAPGATGAAGAGGRAAATLGAKAPVIMVSLGKAVLAALLTGVVGFAAGLSVDRGGPSPPRASVLDVAASTPGTTPASAPGEASSRVAPDKAPRTSVSPDTAPPDTAPPDTAAARAGTAVAATPGSGAGARGEGPGHDRRAAQASGSAAATGSDGAPGSALGAELALLREVQSALREGDGARAERWIDEHAARYPDGVLREEREAARVLLLCAKGRPAEAKSAAERFLARNPRSVQADRVRSSCAFAADADAGAP